MNHAFAGPNGTVDISVVLRAAKIAEELKENYLHNQLKNCSNDLAKSVGYFRSDENTIARRLLELADSIEPVYPEDNPPKDSPAWRAHALLDKLAADYASHCASKVVVNEFQNHLNELISHQQNARAKYFSKFARKMNIVISEKFL